MPRIKNWHRELLLQRRETVNICLEPRLLRGVIKEITEVGVRIGVNGRMGVLSLPLRCVFTDKPLTIGQEVEFYLSYINVL